jgi:hypothetical protein
MEKSQVTGIESVGNIKRIQGERGPIGPYPVEAVTITLLLSSLAIVCSAISLMPLLRKKIGEILKE